MRYVIPLLCMSLFGQDLKIDRKPTLSELENMGRDSTHKLRQIDRVVCTSQKTKRSCDFYEEDIISTVIEIVRLPTEQEIDLLFRYRLHREPIQGEHISYILNEKRLQNKPSCPTNSSNQLVFFSEQWKVGAQYFSRHSVRDCNGDRGSIDTVALTDQYQHGALSKQLDAYLPK